MREDTATDDPVDGTLQPEEEQVSWRKTVECAPATGLPEIDLIEFRNAL
ncbi:MAG: hypothetical protein WKF55_15010 [Gemmatimonadaceae bacterium]